MASDLALTTNLVLPVLCLCSPPSLHRGVLRLLCRCWGGLTICGDQLSCGFLQEALSALDLVSSVTELTRHGYM